MRVVIRGVCDVLLCIAVCVCVWCCVYMMRCVTNGTFAYVSVGVFFVCMCVGSGW